MPSTHDVFEQIVGVLDQPVFIVTAVADGEPSGCLVGFATQASIDPSRFLVGLSSANHTFRIACAADHLAVHVLRRGETDLARLFGGETGDAVDKFARCSWHEGPHGLPILDGAAAWFTGRVLGRTPFGDHVGFLLEPDGGECPEGPVDVMMLSDVDDLKPGHDA